MRNFIVFLILLTACSESAKQEPTNAPVVSSEAKKVSVYEGIIQTEDGEGPIELFLEENETGIVSWFEIRGRLNVNQIFLFATGNYSVLYGAANNEVILKLEGQVHSSVMRVKKGERGKAPKPLDIKINLMSEGGNKLVLVDDDFDRIDDHGRYTLYRRSRLFTVEGYITFEKTRTDYYEQNAAERWTVAPLGVYNDVQRIYDSLATEEFEGVYLRALAYSVESDTVDKEFLVIKSIVEMNKSKAYTSPKFEKSRSAAADTAVIKVVP